MFDALARLTTLRPRLILVLAALVVGGMLWYGQDVGDKLRSGGYVDPASESMRTADRLEDRFPGAQPNVVLLTEADSGDVDDPEVVVDGRQLADRLADKPGVQGVRSYWDGVPQLRSDDGSCALVVGRIVGDEPAIDERLEALEADLAGTWGSLRVSIGGQEAVRHQVEQTVKADIVRAELIGIPIIAVILLFAFRGLVASLLPLLVGVLGLIGTNAILRGLGSVTDVSIFSLNLATGLALGLAVDYALFVVRRYREELAHGESIESAIRITLNTAGRTVLFSSLTVAVALSAMFLFPEYFLHSFAYAGVGVVLFSALAALLLLPAGLVIIGRHIDALDLTRLLQRGQGTASARAGRGSSGWRIVAEAVMARPLLFAGGTIALLLLLGSPFTRIASGLPDDRLLPEHFESHQVQQALRDDFDERARTTVYVLAEGEEIDARDGAIHDYAGRLSELRGVERVNASTGVYGDGDQVRPSGRGVSGMVTADNAYLTVFSDAETISKESERLVRDIRGLPAPFDVGVTGRAAENLDAQRSLSEHIVPAVAMIAATTLILIFLLSGSVLIPVKAVLANTLSLTATFGALVWIFQDGHLSGVFQFQATGWVDAQLLVLLFCAAFGVSMDYEVFLLSRIKEEYGRTGDHRGAVAHGIERTGGVVTTAALVTAVVFLAMATSRVTNIKMFGFGVAVAMLMDATVVRMLLVPSIMRLAGRANWWAPRPLAWVHRHLGLRESPETFARSEACAQDSGSADVVPSMETASSKKY